MNNPEKLTHGPQSRNTPLGTNQTLRKNLNGNCAVLANDSQIGDRGPLRIREAVSGELQKGRGFLINHPTELCLI